MDNHLTTELEVEAPAQSDEEIEKPKYPPIDAQPTRISFSRELNQDQSPLFQLPVEVRNHIYAYTFASFEDTTRPYDKDTHWYRPDCQAPQKTDTTLLRTCKRAYNEAWRTPWESRLITVWLTNPNRCPRHPYEDNCFDIPADDIDYAMEEPTMHDNLFRPLDSRSGHVPIPELRFIAQLYNLEAQTLMDFALHTLHFRPRLITITIRHTDWWYWENDDPLYIASGWVRGVTVPSSVRQLRIEMETLQRKKEQLDSLVDQMKRNWHFRLDDDVGRLTARDTPVVTGRWQGSSTFETFHGRRYIRDETEPDVLDYYTATVQFRHEPDLADAELSEVVDVRNTFEQPRIVMEKPFLLVQDLRKADVPPGTPAQRAVEMVEAHRSTRRPRGRCGTQS